MLQDIITVSDKVEKILRDHPDTRDSDKLLWLAYSCKHTNLKTLFASKNFDYLTFKKWLMHEDTPMFESLSRARRKIQEDNPELQGDKPLRMEEAEQVSLWAKGTL